MKILLFSLLLCTFAVPEIHSQLPVNLQVQVFAEIKDTVETAYVISGERIVFDSVSNRPLLQLISQPVGLDTIQLTRLFYFTPNGGSKVYITNPAKEYMTKPKGFDYRLLKRQ